jgi:bifunctional non-homologous end joining protein LigD
MARPLGPYASKRTFTRTPEPAPKVVSRSGPLLFVIQKHAARRLHYDFRLELDGVLKSWAVPKGPSLELGDKRLAVEVEDHPFDYASFEGVIPEKQYGAGNVIVWDCGVYSPDEGQQYSFSNRAEAEERVRKELAAGKLSFFLRGEKLKGSFALVRTTSDPKQWLLLKHKDRFANTGEVLSRSHSVLSGSVLDELSAGTPLERLDAGLLAPAGPAEDFPKKLSPMLAELAEGIRTETNWTYEPKLDGYRVLAFVENGKVRLISRRGIDYTTPFPEVVADLAAQAVDTMVLDGEITALGEDGRPSFNALQNRAQARSAQQLAEAQRASPAVFVCFDMLHFAGLNLREAPYKDRHRYLAQCLLPSSHVQIVHTSSDAESLYDAALGAGFEGIVAKRNDSPYLSGRRSSNWRKIKASQTVDLVVGGYTKGKGDREPLGAVLLGYWEGTKLRYAGHAGSGFDEAMVTELLARFKDLARQDSPYVEKPPLHRPTSWVEPKLVVEVTFARWTPDGYLREPVFMRVRDDLRARSITAKRVKQGGGKAGNAGATSAAAGAASTSPAGRSGGGAGAAIETVSGRASRSATSAPAKRTTPANEIEDVLHQLAGDAKQLTLTIGAAKLPLSSLDRVYWPADPRFKQPAVTKRDFIRYLAAVSPYMLPHLKDRPLTMIRMPTGIDGERFFQKHWDASYPDFVQTMTVFSEHKDDRHDYILGNNLPTLLWLGQVGSLEFHVWHSRAAVEADSSSRSSDYSSSIEALEASVLNYPDFLVFDIDPYIYSGKEPKGAEPELNKKGFAVGRRVAFWLRDLLKEMSLTAYVKTSGKTGLHVFVPIDRTVTFTEARHICEMVGRHLMKDHPRDITMDWAVIKRTGKIFIDYNMNVRGKTLNVAYSPRGVAGAPVSMPLTWEELEAAEPLDFRVGNVLRRLENAGDRWHDILATKQSLTRAFSNEG